MKRAFNIFICLISGLIVGIIISKLFLGPDWQDAFASPVVIGALIGTAVGFQTGRKKRSKYLFGKIIILNFLDAPPPY